MINYFFYFYYFSLKLFWILENLIRLLNTCERWCFMSFNKNTILQCRALSSKWWEIEDVFFLYFQAQATDWTFTWRCNRHWSRHAYFQLGICGRRRVMDGLQNRVSQRCFFFLWMKIEFYCYHTSRARGKKWMTLRPN